jgi:hypothetical protein
VVLIFCKLKISFGGCHVFLLYVAAELFSAQHDIDNSALFALIPDKKTEKTPLLFL